MKPSTIVITALVAFILVFSTVAQDVEDYGSDESDYDFEGRDEMRPDIKDFMADDGNISGDSDVPASTRILGAVPAFGLGLLGGTVGSRLVQGVGSFLGVRSPRPFSRPAPPPAFYPAPYVAVPPGFPYMFPVPSRSGKPIKRIPGSGIPLTPYVPEIPVNFYRSEDSESDLPVQEDDLNDESFRY